MVLGKLPVPGRPTIWIIVGQGPTAQAASAIGPCPTIFQNVRRPGTGSLPRTIAPPNHPSRHWKFTQDHRTTRPPHVKEKRYVPIMVYLNILLTKQTVNVQKNASTARKTTPLIRGNARSGILKRRY